MKRTIRNSLGLCAIMTVTVMAAPAFSDPKLVLRFLPKDILEAAKDHPRPPLKKRLVAHFLLAAVGGYIVWAMKDNADRIKREKLSFWQAFKRLMAFLYVEKAYDIVILDQLLCMSSGWYQRFYPETKECKGWHDRKWNTKNQLTRLLSYPFICAAQAYLLTKKK